MKEIGNEEKKKRRKAGRKEERKKKKGKKKRQVKARKTGITAESIILNVTVKDSQFPIFYKVPWKSRTN